MTSKKKTTNFMTEKINKITEYVKDMEIKVFKDNTEECKWKNLMKRNLNNYKTKTTKDEDGNVIKETKQNASNISILLDALHECIEEKEDLEQQVAKFSIQDKVKMNYKIEKLERENNDLNFRMTEMETKLNTLMRNIKEKDDIIKHKDNHIKFLSP